MRSSRVLRCLGMAVLAVASFGMMSVAAAQDATEDPMMSMEGACPEGLAVTKLAELGMEMGMTDMDMTEEPMAEATHDMSDMDMTEEPMEMTEEALMRATCFYTELEGANEVPGPGDDDGYGVALVSIDPGTGDVLRRGSSQPDTARSGDAHSRQ